MSLIAAAKRIIGIEKDSVADLKRRGYNKDIINENDIDLIKSIERIESIDKIEDIQYVKDIRSIEKQLDLILPFYKDYFNFLDLMDNHLSETSLIEFNKTKILIIKDNDNWYCDIAMNTGVGANHLYCNIGKTCKINEIHNRKGGYISAIDVNSKKKLMTILNKVINVYNKRHRGTECENIEIMPISLVENKVDYDKFLSESHKIKPVVELPFSKLISIKTIEEQCHLDTLEYKLETNKNIKDDTPSAIIHDINKQDINR